MTATRRRRWWRRVGLVAAAAFLAVVLPSLAVGLFHPGDVTTAAAAPAAPVAIVFGAGLAQGQVPSRILAERLDAAIALYRAGKVPRLLLSGDNSDRYHDETGAMTKYARAQGIPESDLIADDFGVSTYDTCWRARHVFGVERAVLVTQRFHLPRALFLANALGVDAEGVAADRDAAFVSPYVLRELLSRTFAVGMVVLKPDAKSKTGGGTNPLPEVRRPTQDGGSP